MHINDVKYQLNEETACLFEIQPSHTRCVCILGARCLNSCEKYHKINSKICENKHVENIILNVSMSWVNYVMWYGREKRNPNQVGGRVKIALAERKIFTIKHIAQLNIYKPWIVSIVSIRGIPRNYLCSFWIKKMFDIIIIIFSKERIKFV